MAPDPNYVSFGNVARNMLHEQCQYIARYVGGFRDGTPDLALGLRILGDPGAYHSLTIHKDDVEEFVRRVTQYRNRNV